MFYVFSNEGFLLQSILPFCGGANAIVYRVYAANVKANLVGKKSHTHT